MNHQLSSNGPFILDLHLYYSFFNIHLFDMNLLVVCNNLDFTPYFLLLPSRSWWHLFLVVFLYKVNCTGIDVLRSWWNFYYTKNRCLSQWDSFSWDDSNVYWIFWILQQPLCNLMYAGFYLLHQYLPIFCYY